MTQDALHPAEMKGKPHQSQKAIKASRKKKAYSKGGGVDPEATKRHARNEKKLRAIAEKKKQDFLDDAKKVGGKASVRQGRPRAAVRDIKARDADKERDARMIGKKAEALRAKNDPNKKVRKSKEQKSTDKKIFESLKNVYGEKIKPAQRRTSAMDEKGRQIKKTTTTTPRSTQTLAGVGAAASMIGGPLAKAAGLGGKVLGKTATSAGKVASKARSKATAKAKTKAKAAKVQNQIKKFKAKKPMVKKKSTWDKLYSHGGPVKKDQGYNARLDESMGARNKTKRQQSLKSRRNESEAMEKKGGRRKFAAVKTMDKGSRKKKPRGVGAALKGWGKAHHG